MQNSIYHKRYKKGREIIDAMIDRIWNEAMNPNLELKPTAFFMKNKLKKDNARN